MTVLRPARLSDPLLRPLWMVFAAAMVLVAGLAIGRPYLHGASFVVEAAGINGAAARLAAIEAAPVGTLAYRVPWRGGTLRARAYQPRRPTGRGIMLVPGVHASGIEEPRLVGFARDLAAQGHPGTDR